MYDMSIKAIDSYTNSSSKLKQFIIKNIGNNNKPNIQNIRKKIKNQNSLITKYLSDYKNEQNMIQNKYSTEVMQKLKMFHPQIRMEIQKQDSNELPKNMKSMDEEFYAKSDKYEQNLKNFEQMRLSILDIPCMSIFMY